ncbi:hypothetical protein GW846_02495 [Candidatus Gracilibacteria bacterium]|nr:hypothetical protein [Candidatus Gracilibacteria bacterium]
MCPTKKLILGAVVATMCFFGNTIGAAANEETYFIATAYYSPLPGQDSYITGSYSGDVRLNGEGVTTASGGGVFPGLLAGPKNYPFGTKIYFEGFGIGSIQDRGGAIVKAGQRNQGYDRLDIWMGYGDEGLQRAIKWGRKTVKAKIVVPSSEITLNFGESQIGYIKPSLRVEPENEGDNVKELQEIFSKVNLYNGEIDGKYESIKNELISFQLESGIITEIDSEDAGYFGPKTIVALRERYGYSSANLVEEPIELFSKYNHKQASEHYKIILQYGDLVINNDTKNIEDIYLFQEMMTQIGEYNGPIDGKYSSVKKALVDLQIKIGLIDSADHWYAGNFGNRTKTTLFEYYENNPGNPPNNVLERIVQNYQLKESEKNQISSALVIIKQRLQQQELRTGKSAELILSGLDAKINEVLPDIKNAVLKAKIVYLQQIL